MITSMHRKMLSILVIAAMLLTMLPAPAAIVSAAKTSQTELVSLTNPGFEDVNEATGWPVGWSRWDGSSDGFDGMSVTDSVYYGGSGKSLKLDVPATIGYGVLSDLFPVTGGDTYTVTSSVYVESINSDTYSNVTLFVYYYDSDGKRIDDNDIFKNTHASTITKNKWFDVSVDVDMPTNAAKARILINVNKATVSVVYYDNFRVTHYIPEVNEGRPVNGSFDSPLNADNSIKGWAITPAAATADNYASLDSAEYVSAPNSLKLYDNSTASTVATSDKFNVTEGNIYSLTLQAKHVSGTSPWVYWYFFNAAGQRLDSNGVVGNLYTSVASGTLGLTVSNGFKSIADSKFTNIVAPKGAVTAQLAIQFGTSAKGVSYIDDVVITEKRVLQNAGFEKPLVNSEIPNWSNWADLDPNQSITLSSEKVFSGTQSLRFYDNSASSMGFMSDPIDVVGGKTYGASATFHIEKGSAATSGTAQLYIYFYDKDGKELAAGSKNATAPTDKWSLLYSELVAPSNAATAKVMVYSGSAIKGTVYYDAITFEEVPMINLPYEYGAPVSLGDATAVAKTQAGAVGNGEIYFGTNGSPATFYAVDALTGKVNFSEPLPGEDVIWAVVVGSDNNVYVSGTQTGKFYKYSPTEKKLEMLGTNPSNKWVWQLDASKDGRIFGSTSATKNGKSFIYNTNTGQFTDLGIGAVNQDYVRGGGVSEKYFYAGTGTTAYLYRYSLDTLTKEEVVLPITGAETSISNIYAYNDLLFVVYGTSMIIMNEETQQILQTVNWQSPDVAFDGLISPPSPYNEDLVYFRNKNTSKLWTYNTKTNAFAIADEDLTLPNLSSKAMDWVTGPDGRQKLLIMTEEIQVTLYDPELGTSSTYNIDANRTGVDVQSLETGPDGNLYMGGYQGAMSVYDTAKGEFMIQAKEPHQIEGIGFINDKAYFGIYGGAVIYEYDATQPFEMGVNPHIIHDIQSEQSRPFVFETGEDKLFVGTIADYGKLGGALTVYDPATGQWKEHRTGFEELSVIGLAYKEGIVYGGTSIWGGLGIEPSATKAKMFEWNVASESLNYFEPNIPDFNPQMIGELSIGPNGNLWGIMWGQDSLSESVFVIFEMNPATKAIVQHKKMYTGAKASTWRPFFMRWNEHDGMLYTTIGRELYVFDPANLASKKLVNDYVHLMSLGPDGSIYYADGAELIKLPVRMNGAELSASSSKVIIGEEIDLNVSLSLANGQTGNTDGTVVTYTVSDPSIAEVVDGKLIGKKRGSVTVSATVVQDTVQVTTNSITVDVTYASVFSITSMKFTDWNNQPVVELQPNAMIQAEVQVVNNTDTAEEAILIVALYDAQGQMVNASTLSRTFAADTEDVIQAGFRLPSDVAGYTIRAMVWDNVTDMNPLASAISMGGN